MSKIKPRSMEDYKKMSKEMEIILDNIPGLVFFKDTNNNFIRGNKGIADAYNLSKEELKGKSLFELHSKEQAQAYWDDDLEVIRNAKPKLNIEERWETKEGVRWLNTNKIPYIDDNGKIKGIIGFSADITERKKAEEKLEESKAKLKVLNDELEIKVEERTHDLGERVKELTCLYDVSKLIEETKTIDEYLLQKIANRIPLSMQYPNITCTRILMEGQEYKTNNFKRTSRKLSADINVDLNRIGIIEIFYLKEKPLSYCGPFLQEEKNLIDALAEIIGRSIKRKQAEIKLREAEIRYRTTFEQSPDGIIIADLDTLKAVEFNDMICDILEYSREEFAELQVFDHIVKMDLPEIRDQIKRVLKKGRDDFEIKMRTKNGEIKDIYVTAKVITLEGKIYFQSICRDITDRKRAEDKIKEQYEFLSNVIESLSHPFYVINADDYSIELANINFDDHTGHESVKCFAQTHKLDKPCTGTHPCPLEIIKQTKKPVVVEHIHYDEDEQPKYYEVHGFPIFDEKGKVTKMIEYNLNITERKKAEVSLRESEESFRTLTENANDGILIVNRKEEFVYANRRMSEITGYNVDDLLALKIKDLSHPDEFQKIIERSKKKVKGKLVPRQYETMIINRDGENVPVEITAAKTIWKGTNADIIVFRDITERKKGDLALHETLEKLKRSNEDLEQFAYIASHDLQEPLRMVASFTQLLQKRYHDKLDTDANDFINFAVDGTLRMQRLINDLLVFSRVGIRGKPFKATDMNYVLKSVLANFNQLIKENNATIISDPLPVIIADESQMLQLFQNLISNAIKFHDKKAPQIHVSGVVLKNEWRFSVQDKGIGIDSKFFERIFLIFQRIDTNNKYPGRGIGLAICKKIVQRHEGRIWVESIEGKGSTFYISIPRKELNN